MRLRMAGGSSFYISLTKVFGVHPAHGQLTGLQVEAQEWFEAYKKVQVES